jgi:hypothetical protein
MSRKLKFIALWNKFSLINACKDKSGSNIYYKWVIGTCCRIYLFQNNFYFHLYRSPTLCMFRHNFYCIFSRYLSSTQSGVRCLYLKRKTPEPEKPSARGYKCAILFLWDINTGTWGSLSWDSKIWPFCGTSTQEWLLSQGPEAIVQVHYRPVLLSERALQNNKAATV